MLPSSSPFPPAENQFVSSYWINPNKRIKNEIHFRVDARGMVELWVSLLLLQPPLLAIQTYTISNV